jgi:hypothetical protein
MQTDSPILEPLPQGGTMLTWTMHLGVGPEAARQELRFAVRASLATVERLLAERGPERAVWILWTHFRSIPTTQGAIDSERSSPEEWAQAVEALITEVRHDAS